VLINGEPARPTAAGPWKREVLLAETGMTRVEVAVRAGAQCQYREEREYCLAPLEGRKYTFDCGGEVGTLPLEFFRGGGNVQSLWFLLDGAWRELLVAFRASEAGRRFREENPGSHPGVRERRSGEAGVSWREASAVAEWLTRELREGNRILGNQRFGLPAQRQWKLLCEEGRLPWSGSRPRREWLADEGNGLLLGETNAPGTPGRTVFATRDEFQPGFTFRLVLAHGGEKDWVNPKNAAASAPASETRR
jgi:hypothetical protein